ncbi:sigma-54-dependent transcriptional regulator [Clostridium sp. MCC353]|uniref:sigma-54-dependent Fis family transcriptional regulator n=1 Tax=Clostridium sp. MCC353 TaxID=2592646 RepID=UPI001C033AE9|nr:sigma-54-dependent transcriptional regulator [Clostridium sp. MCC353]
MSHILFIASGDVMYQYGCLFQKELPVPNNLKIINLYMDEALTYVKNHLDDDTDVIMARGNTAKLLSSSRLPVPVVTVPITGMELAQTIEKVKSLFGENETDIAYIGMEDLIHAFRGFLDLLHWKVHLYPVKNNQDIEAQVLRAKAENIHVLIGGVCTQKAAQEHGINCVLLECSLSSIQTAYNQAKVVQKNIRQQKKKIQERITIMDSISDGIISINETEKITMINQAARQFFSVSNQAVLGRKCSFLFSQTELELIHRILVSGETAAGHEFSIGQGAYHLDIHPITASKKTEGVILTIRPDTSSTAMSLQVPDTSDPAPSASCKDRELHLLSSRSPAYHSCLSLVKKYAPLSYPVLFIGEQGTGRETLARFMHDNSPYKEGLWIARDAALLTEEDMLSAHGGSLYIRNPEFLSPGNQQILCNIIQYGSFTRSSRLRQSLCIRILAGTSTDLCRLAAQGDFSSALYYSFNAFLVPVLCLSDRPEDLPVLFDRFWKKYCSLFQKECAYDSDCTAVIEEYSWPGNLDQMDSLCRRLVLLINDGDTLSRSQLQMQLSDTPYFSHLPGTPGLQKTLKPLTDPPEPGFIVHGRKITFDELKAMDRYYHGRKSLIAQKLNVSRSTLWRYFKEMELHKNPAENESEIRPIPETPAENGAG